MPAFGLLVADARMPRIVRRGPSRGRVRGRRPAPGDLSPSNARTRPVYSGQAALRSKSSRSAPTRSKPGRDSAPDQPLERCSRPQRDSAQTDPAPADYPTTGRVAEQARNIQPAEIRFDSAWRRQQSAHEPCTRSRPVGSKLRSVPAVANAKNAMLVLWLKLTVRQRLIILVRPATARLAGGLETSRRSSPPPRPHGRRRDLHEIMGGGGRRWQTPKFN